MGGSPWLIAGWVLEMRTPDSNWTRLRARRLALEMRTTAVCTAVFDQVEVDDERVRLAAESLERRQADLELRNDLALADFRGPGWDRYARELVRYGYEVMMAWLKTGRYSVSARLGVVIWGHPHWSGPLMTELSSRTRPWPSQ